MRMGTILIVSALAFASACSQSADGSSPGGRTTVVANFYPVYEVARRVGGDRVQVRNLTPAGAEPHDLELSPKQVDELLDAKVVLYMGLGFQPAVEKVAKERHDGVTVDLLAALSSRLRQLPAGGEEHGTDPHVWLDPVLMGAIVDEVARALARADPGGASTSEQNASGYRTEIEGVDQQYRGGLAHCDR